MTEDPSSWLIVGLGNPGAEYSHTRHNLGFWVLDRLAARWRALDWKTKFSGEYVQTTFDAHAVFLLKPQTYMNLSGKSAGALAQFYKIPPTRTLVVYDDLDIETGDLRIRKGGSAGGHNGMKSIIEALGTEDFPRIRVGIGRPEASTTAKTRVLGKASKAEMALLEKTADSAADAIEVMLKEGIDISMNRFNKRKRDGT